MQQNTMKENKVVWTLPNLHARERESCVNTSRYARKSVVSKISNIWERECEHFGHRIILGFVNRIENKKERWTLNWKSKTLARLHKRSWIHHVSALWRTSNPKWETTLSTIGVGVWALVFWHNKVSTLIIELKIILKIFKLVSIKIITPLVNDLSDTRNISWWWLLAFLSKIIIFVVVYWDRHKITAKKNIIFFCSECIVGNEKQTGLSFNLKINLY